TIRNDLAGGDYSPPEKPAATVTGRDGKKYHARRKPEPAAVAPVAVAPVVEDDEDVPHDFMNDFYPCGGKNSDRFAGNRKTQVERREYRATPYIWGQHGETPRPDPDIPDLTIGDCQDMSRLLDHWNEASPNAIKWFLNLYGAMIAEQIA